MFSILKYFFGSDLQSEKNESERDASTGFDSTNSDFPNAYNSLTKINDGNEPKRIFEPALKQFPNAFRIIEPEISNAQLAREWHDTRMQIIGFLLDVVNASEWKNNLVLRGSLLLKAWLKEAARIPNDIDWIVTPKTISPNDVSTKRFFEHLIKTVSENERIGDAIIETDSISFDEIWAYERAQGRRIVFPWRIENSPVGSIQMDFVFDEHLWREPERVEIPISENINIKVNAADKELSLAWKLMWLETDSYPQGKDLYDATLLAEQTSISSNLLEKMLHSSHSDCKFELNSDFSLKWRVDWDGFKLENPWIKGEAKDWQLRLKKALSKSFD